MYLHKIPKMKTSCTGIKVGDGRVIPVKFVIPLQVMMHGHVFELFMIVSDTDDGIDLVFGMENMVEVESILNTCKQVQSTSLVEQFLYTPWDTITVQT